MIAVHGSPLLLQRSRRDLRGFSLIEILVAIIVMGIIMMGFVSVFRSQVTIWMSGAAAIDMNQNTSVLTLKLSPELRSALPPYVQVPTVTPATGPVNLIGTDVTAGTQLDASANSIDDEIRFHVAARSSVEGADDGDAEPGYGGDSSRRYYWLKKNSATDTRIQTDWTTSKSGDMIPPLGSAVPSNDPLAYSFQGFNIEYRDTMGVWSNNWNARTRGALPSLIRVTARTSKNNREQAVVFIARPGATGTRITQ